MTNDPFAHLAGEQFTAAEAAEYLEISEDGLQALIAAGRLHPAGDGRFPVPELRAIKKSRKVSTIVKAIEHVTPSSGNVFADLGLPDADSLKAKADLAIAITKTIQTSGLTQEAAAGVIGITPSALDDLLRGKFRDIDEARMQEYLQRLQAE